MAEDEVQFSATGPHVPGIQARFQRLSNVIRSNTQKDRERAFLQGKALQAQEKMFDKVQHLDPWVHTGWKYGEAREVYADWFTRLQEKQMYADKQVEPGAYRDFVAKEYQELLSGIQDPEMKNIFLDMAKNGVQELTEQQLVQNLAFNREQNKRTFISNLIKMSLNPGMEEEFLSTLAGNDPVSQGISRHQRSQYITEATVEAFAKGEFELYSSVLNQGMIGRGFFSPEEEVALENAKNKYLESQKNFYLSEVMKAQKELLKAGQDHSIGTERFLTGMEAMGTDLIKAMLQDSLNLPITTKGVVITEAIIYHEDALETLHPDSDEARVRRQIIQDLKQKREQGEEVAYDETELQTLGQNVFENAWYDQFFQDDLARIRKTAQELPTGPTEIQEQKFKNELTVLHGEYRNFMAIAHEYFAQDRARLREKATLQNINEMIEDLGTAGKVIQDAIQNDKIKFVDALGNPHLYTYEDYEAIKIAQEFLLDRMETLNHDHDLFPIVQQSTNLLQQTVLNAALLESDQFHEENLVKHRLAHDLGFTLEPKVQQRYLFNQEKYIRANALQATEAGLQQYETWSRLPSHLKSAEPRPPVTPETQEKFFMDYYRTSMLEHARATGITGPTLNTLLTPATGSLLTPAPDGAPGELIPNQNTLDALQLVYSLWSDKRRNHSNIVLRSAFSANQLAIFDDMFSSFEIERGNLFSEVGPIDFAVFAETYSRKPDTETLQNELMHLRQTTEFDEEGEAIKDDDTKFQTTRDQIQEKIIDHIRKDLSYTHHFPRTERWISTLLNRKFGFADNTEILNNETRDAMLSGKFKGQTSMAELITEVQEIAAALLVTNNQFHRHGQAIAAAWEQVRSRAVITHGSLNLVPRKHPTLLQRALEGVTELDHIGIPYDAIIDIPMFESALITLAFYNKTLDAGVSNLTEEQRAGIAQAKYNNIETEYIVNPDGQNGYFQVSYRMTDNSGILASYNLNNQDLRKAGSFLFSAYLHDRKLDINPEQAVAGIR